MNQRLPHPSLRLLALTLAIALAIPAHASEPKDVVLVGDLAEEDLIALSAATAASPTPRIFLLDTPRSGKSMKAFLQEFQPRRVVPVGSFPGGLEDLKTRLGIKTSPPVEMKRRPPADLWKLLLPNAQRVVVCPPEPRGQLLQCACLAGVLRAPLYVLTKDTETDLRGWIAQARIGEAHAVGKEAIQACQAIPNLATVALADADAVQAAYLHQQRKHGAIATLVLANPADARRGLGSMSLLAPWLAVQRRAALLLTNDDGDNTASLIRQAVKDSRLERADSLLLLADLRAIPMERRPNPAAGKDTFIEMEPLTPTSAEPFTFATGRLFHEDLGVAALILGRQHLLKDTGSPRKALVVSNPGGGLTLLETFSRNTISELRNCGYETTTLLGDDVDKSQVRRLLPQHDIFLWEGHHNTLIKDYGFPDWDEPLPPQFVFLQSCLALAEAKVQPLFQRGAVSVVGSSTRMYSGSGGAFALAYFDALQYEQQSLGGALRQAKNFMLCYALLKEKRLGKSATLGGANLRSAWAFTLWGDPTLKLPAPPRPADARPAVRHEVHGNTITFTIPEETHDKVVTSKYQTEMIPNGRLAGMLTRIEGEYERRLVPLLFAEVSLPHAPANQTPRLRSRVPSEYYVFCWDQRRRCGYLLLRPRAGDRNEVRFRVEWDPQTVVSNPLVGAQVAD